MTTSEKNNSTSGTEKGGARRGAGRKPLPGKFVTTVVLSDSLKADYKRLGGSKWVRQQVEKAVAGENHLPEDAQFPALEPAPMKLPLADSAVHAGFPSPAESYVGERIDLNEMMVDVPAATFYVRVRGDSMDLAGIDHGDMLVVDRSKQPKNGDIVIMNVNSEFTVKRFIKRDGQIVLHPESSNRSYLDIFPKEGDIWNCVGVVTFIIKKA